jgi:hypothetical protein
MHSDKEYIDKDTMLAFIRKLAGDYTIEIIALETERNALKRRVAELEQRNAEQVLTIKAYQQETDRCGGLG